jgi:hypothetical protein
MEDTDKVRGMEYRKGCPACEHSDPELERELRAFAQLLLDIYLDKKQLGVQKNRNFEKLE